MPMALEYADRLRACNAAIAAGAEPPRLLAEFQAAQRFVASEAVYNSMIATVTAVGLGDSSEAEDDAKATEGDVADDDPERYAYHDMTQPVELIARRLLAYHARVQASPAMRDERQTRLLHASFIVEFGLEHGLPDRSDLQSETMLKEFLARLGEWEGGRDSEVVRGIVLEHLPPGRAGHGLRAAALDWFEEHKGAALVGGAIAGGLIGVLVAGAAVAIASRRR